MNRLLKNALPAAAALLLLAACAGARLHDAGLKDVDAGRYEAGVEKLRQAVDKAPDNLQFKSDLLRQEEESVRRLIAQGDAAHAAGDLEAATAAYKRVLAIEPNNSRGTRGLDSIAGDARHAQAVAQAQSDFNRGDYDTADARVGSVLAEDPGYDRALALRSRIEAARGPVTITPRLKTRDNRPVTLQFRDAPTKMVFEVLSRQTGINFIFDKDVRSDGKTTIFVQDVPIESAIDLVLGQNQLARQVLSENLVLIYPNTAAKQKDYQDQIVKTFYLDTAVPKDVESLLKTVLDIKTLVVNERANTITVRETPEVVRMAEKLVASVDIAEPEVMLEVEVLEVTRSKLTQLGISYPGTATISTPKNLVINDFNGGSQSAINGNSISVSPLSMTVDALKTTSNANVLASPRIRARNKEKSKILIGVREPVITTAASASGTGGVISNTNVQYLDVGLTLDVEPTIYADGDVAIKTNLEVSSITNKLTVPTGNGGTTVAYEISTRNASTLLQLRDGETQVLAGLIRDSDQRNATRIPGLGDIPLLGRLFSDHGTDRQKSEVVLSITPHIIRARARPSSDKSEFWYGTESRSGMAPLATGTRQGAAPAGQGSAAPSAPAAQPAAQAPTTLAVPPPGGVNVSSMAGDTAVGGPVPAAGAPAAAPVASGGMSVAPTARVAAVTGITEVPSARPAQPDGPAPKVTATLNGPAQVKPGDEFTVSLQLDSDQPIGRARVQVRWDGATFQLLGGDPGSGVPASSGAKVIGRVGGAQLDITSPDDPVPAGAELLQLRFKALQGRPTTAIAGQVSVMAGSGAIVASSTPPPLTISVGN